MRIIKSIRVLSIFATENTIYRKMFSKCLLGASIVGLANYFVDSPISHLNSALLHRSPIISVMASTSDDDKIKPLNYIADVVESFRPSLVNVTVGRSDVPISIGSGVIVDSSGYVLTSAQVVGKNTIVYVKLETGNTFLGEVVGYDKKYNLALIKFNPVGVKLQPATMPDTTNIHNGEFVIAFGYPVFSSSSVTVGTVSDIDKEISFAKGIKYIQSNALIACGSFGGPLVNVNGEVVGINTRREDGRLTYTIPITDCKRFLQLVMHRRKVKSTNATSEKKLEGDTNMFLGVVMCTFNETMATEFYKTHPKYTIKPQSGVIIKSVFDMSPASISGIHCGDIIESVDGTKVFSPAEVMNSMTKLESFDIVIIRRGKRISLKNVTPDYSI